MWTMLLELDERIPGRRQHVLTDERHPFMLIPDEIRKCVGFVYYQDAAGDRWPAGTAFFVALDIPGSDRHWVYVVTARHVIDSVSRRSHEASVYLRLNSKASGFHWVRSEADQWIFHPDDPTVDIAILNWTPPPDIIDYLSYPLSSGATEDVIAREDISVGEEVFLTGLFVNHYKTERNIPIVRVGNIAAMPGEPVRTRAGLMEAYLIESRSIGGLSGSPVFVHLGIVRQVEGQVRFARAKGGVFYLLGLMHGHWDLPRADADAVVQDDLRNEAVNMGIAIVVPVTKILEVINQPRLEATRKIEEERLRREGLLALDATPELPSVVREQLAKADV